MDTMEKLGGVVLTIVLVSTVVALLLGLPVMLLWNALMPDIFGLPTISFWQAIGLNILSSILFKTTVNTKN